MYVYDEANNLAKSIKESEEFLGYKKIKEELDQMPEMKTKIEEFNKLQYDLQVLSFKGETPDQEKMQKLQAMYEILVKEEKIKAYFDAQVKFNIMLADVNKIISEAVKETL